MCVDGTAYLAQARDAIRRKRLLRRIYEEWYARLGCAIPPGDGGILELGAGAGFLSKVLPGVIASDVLPNGDVDLRMDGCRLPFGRCALRAVVMTDVFHHLPDAAAFLAEATRCLRPGGVVVMIEPWVTPWTRLLFGRLKLHHEPFEPGALDWRTPVGGPIAGSNNALAWIVFERDRAQFERRFPRLIIQSIDRMMPV